MVNILSDFNHGERDIAEKLKKLDFSQISSAHKTKLWEMLCVRGEPLQLSDDELDFVQAASGEGEEEEYGVCPLCGIKSGENKKGFFKCDSCGAFRFFL